MATSTHYLATAAAIQVFQQGGNAIDAGVAAGLCLATVERDLTDFGGIAPIMVYSARKQEVVSIAGVGRWPLKASLHEYIVRFGSALPSGIARAITPSAPDAWLIALQRYGRLSFEAVAEPARQLAAHGFPVFPRLANSISRLIPILSSWPSSAAVFLPNGVPPRVGDLLLQPDLADTFARLGAVERSAWGTRIDRLQAVRDYFYKGEVARDIVNFSRQQDGLLSMEDMESLQTVIEPPVATTYRDVDVLVCGPWSQGPVIPIALNLLCGFDLKTLGHNSGDYIHTLVECLDLAFADREAFFGDPDFVHVPLEGLLSYTYADVRRKLINPMQSFRGMAPAGDPVGYAGRRREHLGLTPALGSDALETPGDTSYVCTADAEGNVFSATPSDPCVDESGGPLIPGLGFMISLRGSQSRLDAAHPASLQPGKRPRVTPNPALALKDGRPLLGFGTPGGDAQTQAMIQVLLNIIDFGMEPQRAIEQPRAISLNFPGSFAPNAYYPNRLLVEAGLGARTLDELSRMGHVVEEIADFSFAAGAVCVVEIRDNGTLLAGADPRRECYAAGW